MVANLPARACLLSALFSAGIDQSAPPPRPTAQRCTCSKVATKLVEPFPSPGYCAHNAARSACDRVADTRYLDHERMHLLGHVLGMVILALVVELFISVSSARVLITSLGRFTRLASTCSGYTCSRRGLETTTATRSGAGRSGFSVIRRGGASRRHGPEFQQSALGDVGEA